MKLLNDFFEVVDVDRNGILMTAIAFGAGVLVAKYWKKITHGFPAAAEEAVEEVVIAEGI